MLEANTFIPAFVKTCVWRFEQHVHKSVYNLFSLSQSTGRLSVQLCAAKIVFMICALVFAS